MSPEEKEKLLENIKNLPNKSLEEIKKQLEQRKDIIERQQVLQDCGDFIKEIKTQVQAITKEKITIEVIAQYYIDWDDPEEEVVFSRVKLSESNYEMLSERAKIKDIQIKELKANVKNKIEKEYPEYLKYSEHIWNEMIEDHWKD